MYPSPLNPSRRPIRFANGGGGGDRRKSQTRRRSRSALCWRLLLSSSLASHCVKDPEEIQIRGHHSIQTSCPCCSRFLSVPAVVALFARDAREDSLWVAALICIGK